MKSPHPILTIVLVMVLVLGLTPTVSAKGKPGGGGGNPPDPPPPYDPAIAYSTWIFGAGDVYAMNGDGSNKTLLIQDSRYPAWLPADYLVFVYVGAALDGEGIYVIDALDPQILAKIADPGGIVDYLIANPADPDMIAWSAWSEGSTEVIFGIQDSVGWHTVVVDTHPDLLFVGSWSPDGTRITAGVFDTVSNTFKDDWIYEVTYDEMGLPADLTPLRNVTESMAAQGWDLEITDWSGQSDRWLLASGNQGSQWPYSQALFLVDLSPVQTDPPVFHIIAEDSKVAFRSAKWSPCDDRVLVEEVSSSQSLGGGSHKLTVYDLAFDESSGDVLGVTGANEFPSSRKEQLLNPDWRPARPGECPAP